MVDNHCKKEILIITRNFPPLVGGMERLLRHTYEELRIDFNCQVIGPTGASEFVAEGHVSECFTKPVSLFLFVAFCKGLWHASTGKIRLAVAGSGVTAPVAVLLGFLFRFPVAVFVHGLDLVVDDAIYQNFFIPSILRADIIIANSENTARLAREAGVANEKIHIIHPGVDYPSQINRNIHLRKQYNIKDEDKILLSVGRLIPRKGVAQFIRETLPLINQQLPQVLFVIIGDFPDKALKKNIDSKKELQLVIEENNLDNKVLMLGSVEDQVLQDFLVESDLLLFPVLDIPGDVEGFGMVAVEAAAHGLPTFAFDVGGVADAVCHQVSGKLFQPGDYKGLAEQIIEYLSGNIELLSVGRCRSFAKQFSWNLFGARIRQVCKMVSEY